MLEDYHKILTEKSNGGEKFTLNDVKECMKKGNIGCYYLHSQISITIE